MTLRLLTLAVLLVLPLVARAQPVEPAPSNEEKGPFLGVLISPVPDILYAQVPDLPRGEGVVINYVLPDSPALLAGLRRHDILLRYNEEHIQDCEHFARLLRAGKRDDKVKLELFRSGRKMTVEATLTEGPMLKVVEVNGLSTHQARMAPAAHGTAKAGGPPSVSVSATPLENDRMKVTIEYYQDGRQRTATYEGTLDEIDTKVQKLPARVQTLANVALRRLRDYEFQPKVGAASASPTEPRKP